MVFSATPSNLPIIASVASMSSMGTTVAFVLGLLLVAGLSGEV